VRRPLALLVLIGLAAIGVVVVALPIVMGSLRGWSRYSDAVLLVHAPVVAGGVLMIVASDLLKRARRAGRVVATAGAALVAGAGTLLATAWMSLDQEAIGLVGLAYSLAHIAVIVLIWRGHFDPDVPAAPAAPSSASTGR